MNEKGENIGMVDFEKKLDKESVLLYNNRNSAIDGGVMMKARDALDAALRETGKTQAEAAARVGWVPQQLNNRLGRNSLKADEFLEVLEGIGVEITMTVKETGKVIRLKSQQRRVKKMVKGVTYDTAAAGVVANNFYADGVNKYDEDGYATELYIDKENRYFFVDYHRDDPKLDEIRVMSKSSVDDFIEKYGKAKDKEMSDVE